MYSCGVSVSDWGTTSSQTSQGPRGGVPRGVHDGQLQPTIAQLAQGSELRTRARAIYSVNDLRADTSRRTTIRIAILPSIAMTEHPTRNMNTCVSNPPYG